MFALTLAQTVTMPGGPLHGEFLGQTDLLVGGGLAAATAGFVVAAAVVLAGGGTGQSV
ncbi:hypothetical protein [Haloarchaeobius sp. DT45]|uniref:hypothetical protein n=1 Tax=Haloarchaeobius sp. DT45 TaxID=3446116 RepID=UPI003F6CFC92